MNCSTAQGQGEAGKAAEAMVSAKLPADPRSVQEARSAVRRTLKFWGMADLSGDTELLASELVANAVEHAGGESIGFALRRRADVAGQPAVTCEVSDASPTLPTVRDTGPDAERGRGLMIVAALASGSGVQTSPGGKTTWFTLAPSAEAS